MKNKKTINFFELQGLKDILIQDTCFDLKQYHKQNLKLEAGNIVEYKGFNGTGKLYSLSTGVSIKRDKNVVGLELVLPDSFNDNVLKKLKKNELYIITRVFSYKH